MLMDILTIGFLLFAAYGVYVILSGQDPGTQLAHDVTRLKKRIKLSHRLSISVPLILKNSISLISGPHLVAR